MQNVKANSEEWDKTDTKVSANNTSIHFAAGAFRIRIFRSVVHEIYIKGSNDKTE